MSARYPTTQRRWALLPLLALLHLGAWLLLVTQWRQPTPKQAATERIEMRLLTRPVPRKPLPQPTPRFAAPIVSKAPTATTTPRGHTITTPALQATQAMDATPPTETIREEAAPGLLINTEATRRALRQATRSPLLSERAAQAMGDGPPLEQSVRLGQEIKKAGNGDCLKGEFAGSGAGLLSLPFWLLAEARGKCAR